MTVVRGHGIEADLPAGVEGRIMRRAPVGDEQTYPVVHLSTIAIPYDVADSGNGGVQLLRSRDVYVVLLEYGPESAAREMFRHPKPDALASDDFKSYRARSGTPNQAGAQRFFVESGRPFTLHAVLGSDVGRRSLIPLVNRILGGITIGAAA